MLIDYHLGQTSIVLRVKIRNSSVATGAGLTGLTNASSGLIISTIADNEATATAYTVAGSTIDTITTLGTYAAPTSGHCRFKEVDSTNHKGVYEIQIADARFAVSSAKSLLVSISGAANAADCDVCIPLRTVNPYDANNGLTNLDAAVSTRSAPGDSMALTSLHSRVAHSGTAQAGASTSITLAAGASSQDGQYTGCLVKVYSATGAQQARTVTAYDGTTKVATVDRGWATNPDATSLYAVLYADNPTLNGSLQTTAASVQGNVTGSVGSVAGAVGSVTGNVGGNVAGSVNSVTSAVIVGTNNDKTGYDVTSLGGSTNAGSVLKAMCSGTTSVTVNDASATTTGAILAAANGDTLSSSDGFYSTDGMQILFTSGALKGIMSKITAYTGATKATTWSPALPSAPANGVSALIIGRSN